MKNKIPLFDLNYGEEEEEAVLNTIRSKWISTGPKCAELENRFAEMLNCKYAVSLSSCTSALHLALKVLNIKDGDEVITPSLSFVATANAIKYVGAKPVFCDIKSHEDLTIDPDKIIELINPKTKAIMVMHYAGFPCDMDKIMTIAKENNLRVIEDACHGPLSEYNDDKLGTIGDIGCFSFFSNKNISTGEGGMLVTNNEDIFNQVKLLRSHGMTTLSYERSKGHGIWYDVVDLGYNYRMDDIRATLGIVQLSKLKNDLYKRALIRKKYVEKLSKIKKIIIPFKKHSTFVSNYIFVIVIKDSSKDIRNKMRTQLADKGIETSIHYPPIHRFKIFRDKSIQLPITEYVADNLISLPLFGSLQSKDIDFITEQIKRNFN